GDISMIQWAEGPQDGQTGAPYFNSLDFPRTVADTNNHFTIIRSYADPNHPLYTYPFFAIPDNEVGTQNVGFAPVIADDNGPNQEFFFSDAGGAFMETTTSAEPATRLKAGNGGHSLIGRGGVGGSIGS